MTLMSETITLHNQPISIFPGKKQDGTPNFRLVMSTETKDLANIPEELFALKVSQSQKPERRGQIVFKYFSFALTQESGWSDLVPQGLTTATPLAEIKNAVVTALSNRTETKVQFTVNMPGKFGNIDTPQGRYTIFDFTEFPPDGKPGYYLKGGTIATVELKPSMHSGNPYFRVTLSTESNPEDIFVKSGRAKIFGEETPTASLPEQDVYQGESSESGSVIWP